MTGCGIPGYLVHDDDEGYRDGRVHRRYGQIHPLGPDGQAVLETVAARHEAKAKIAMTATTARMMPVVVLKYA